MIERPRFGAPPAPFKEPAAEPSEATRDSGLEVPNPFALSPTPSPWTAEEVAGAERPGSSDESSFRPGSMAKSVANAVGQTLTLGRSIGSLMGNFVSGDFQEGLRQLERVSPDKLDEVIRGLRGGDGAGFLIKQSSLHPVVGPLVLRFLSANAQHLTVETKGRLIDQLQKRSTLDPDEQRLVADLFLATSGSDTTLLKNFIDAGNDPRDLKDLVFKKLTDPRSREAVLNHIRAEARAVTRNETKVLSDVDDTVKESWTDVSLPKQTVMPGVIAFLDALQGGDGQGVGKGDLAMLTARFGMLEQGTHDSLNKIGITRKSVLENTFETSGGVETGKEYFQRAIDDPKEASLDIIAANQAIARGKTSNFEKFAELYPEYRLVFVGDSGQGDPIVANNEAGTLATASFIHDIAVVGGSGIEPKTSSDDREAAAEKNIHYFDTYAGAAAVAYEQGLISAGALRTIARAVVNQTKAALLTPEQRDYQVEVLNQDLTAVNEALGEEAMSPVSAEDFRIGPKTSN